MEIFSLRLKWTREKFGFTQKDMSEKLEMSQQGYGKIELNQREPNLETLTRICKILGESADFFLGIDELNRHSKIAYSNFQNSYSRYLSFQKELTDELKSTDDSEYKELRLKYLKGVIVGNHNSMIKRHETAMKYVREIPGLSDQVIDEYMAYKNINV